ncbi:hypothetical protein DFS34DRAFT_698642 [Phlyctochytrium arcticum]|nr:hypothetical protein DFS34DRAFT_698642 [Phlyctochytrium arcticum]
MNIEAPPEPEPLKITKDFVMEKFQAAIIAKPESKGTLVTNKNRMLNKFMPHFKLDQNIDYDTIEGECYEYLENSMKRRDRARIQQETSEQYVPYDELWTRVDTKLNTLDKTNIQEIQKGIVLSLYVHYLPRRNPYATLTYRTGLNSYSNGVITLRDYKTHNRVTWLYFQNIKIFKVELICRINIQGDYRCSIDLDKLAQNFICWNVKEGRLKFMKEKIELADAMGHSVTAQTRAYTYRTETTEETNTRKVWDQDEIERLRDLSAEYDSLAPEEKTVSKEAL